MPAPRQYVSVGGIDRLGWRARRLGHGGPAGCGVDVDRATLPLRAGGGAGRRPVARAVRGAPRRGGVRRAGGLHGPMVLGVCRRILRDGHDVEDAFQATFLVLVKRAGSIRDPGRLGPWLHGVARRVAMRARAEALRRRSHQDPSGPAAVAEEPAVRPTSRAEGDDVLGVIDEEVARLPSRYRDAVVLCDLEGRSYAEAARRLSCPMGTLQSRLARGRARLRTRLVRRGSHRWRWPRSWPRARGRRSPRRWRKRPSARRRPGRSRPRPPRWPVPWRGA